MYKNVITVNIVLNTNKYYILDDFICKVIIIVIILVLLF